MFDEDSRRACWHAIGLSLTAHVIMLRDVAIIDDQIAAALLTAIDGVTRGDPPEAQGSFALVAAFDERVDNLVPAAAVGAIRIARSRHDVAATSQRILLRDGLLAVADAEIAARGALLDLADNHVFTLLAVWSQGVPLQPTNLSHFLTGTIAPLARAATRLQQAYGEINRSPLGASALVGPGLPVDRDESADFIGSQGPIESTFDALSAVDHLTAVANTVSEVVSPIRRLLDEFMAWLRTDPQAIRFTNEVLAPEDPNLPHFRPPQVIEGLAIEARRVEEDAGTVSRLARALPYGPTGQRADLPVNLAIASLQRGAALTESVAGILVDDIEINRAWLARGAGRSHVTSGDLAEFLMTEESLDPASARNIAAMTTGRAIREGLEASSITPAMIDASALLVIGRELGVEIERLGAYLAPRRFIEKRTVLGGPAPSSIREYLESARQRLSVDRHWLDERRRQLALAAENLDIRSHEILDAAS